MLLVLPPPTALHLWHLRPNPKVSRADCWMAADWDHPDTRAIPIIMMILIIVIDTRIHNRTNYLSPKPQNPTFTPDYHFENRSSRAPRRDGLSGPNSRMGIRSNACLRSGILKGFRKQLALNPTKKPETRNSKPKCCILKPKS